MFYKIIDTGSHNAVIIDRILIDCGVTASELEPYIGDFDAVYITHTHSDHVTVSALNYLHKNNIKIYTHDKNKKSTGNALHKFKMKFKPAERAKIINYISENEEIQIDTLTGHIDFRLGIKVKHNVPNFTIHMKIADNKVFYITDAGAINRDSAPDYDYYFIECNYRTETINKLMMDIPAGQFNRFKRSIREHLSEDQCLKFFKKNAKPGSRLIKLHQSSIAYRKIN